MAILAAPFVPLYLVEHAAGGALLSGASGYIAGTHISANIVAAFGAASSALSQIGGVTAAVVSNPIVLGVATIAVVAVGSYCYFHGIPAPIAETLSSLGLGTVGHHGLVVAVPQLALALVVLGGAGYVAYRFYESENAARSESLRLVNPNEQNSQTAREAVEAIFGKAAWSAVGEAAWSAIGSARQSAAKAGQDAIDKCSEFKSTLSQTAASAGSVAADLGEHVADVASQAGKSLGSKFLTLVRSLFGNLRRQT